MNSRAEQYVRSLIGFKEKHQLILTKLYALKARLVDAPTSPHLVDVSLAKVRYTVDRKFPILVDLSQVNGLWLYVRILCAKVVYWCSPAASPR